MRKCDRCKKETNSFRMSFFNQDMLCPECLKEESEHPMYKAAKDEERQQVLNGNYNYEGVGLPEDLAKKYKTGL